MIQAGLGGAGGDFFRMNQAEMRGDGVGGKNHRGNRQSENDRRSETAQLRRRPAQLPAIHELQPDDRQQDRQSLAATAMILPATVSDHQKNATVTTLCAGTSSDKASRAFLELAFKTFCGSHGNKFPVCRSDHCSPATVFRPTISVQRAFGLCPPNSAAESARGLA